MRSVVLCGFLVVVGLVPKVGTAQVFFQPTPPPLVNAANESWQMNGEPVFSDGIAYYAAGPTVFFDGNVMTRTGVYRGIPLYQDRTLEPHSIVFVPVGGNVMRPYERRREGELAGTTGSRTPSFPVQMASPTAALGAADAIHNAGALPGAESSAGTGGSAVPPPGVTLADASRTTAAGGADTATPARVSLMSVNAPQMRGPQGIWIEFGGERWYSAGTTASFDPERFAPAGTYHGFPVYRAREGSAEEIFVPAVPDGPLTTYRRQ